MSFSRKLTECGGLVFEPVPPDFKEGETLRAFLIRIWNDAKDAWVLGHAMDGVIWGKVCGGSLILAHDVEDVEGMWSDGTDKQRWGAPLVTDTLMDLRIFNPDQELRLWRYDQCLRACLVKESKIHNGYQSYDEGQILLAGNRIGKPERIGKVIFSLLEGPAGQRQAIPVDWDGKEQTYRLWVRHYVFPREDNGMLTVVESRLLEVAKAQKF